MQIEKRDITYVMRVVVFLIPFFIGWYGIYQLGEGDYIDCAYKSVQLYLMEFAVEARPLNLMTQTARIAAPLMTATYIGVLLLAVAESLKIRFRLLTQEAVAIHGDSSNVDLIQERLGRRAIVSEHPVAFRAKRQVLMFEDDLDMYHYMDQHGTSFFHEEEKEIFLCSEKILRGCYENKKLIVCNVAENCARYYWNKYPVRNEKERILLIGFHNYGQRLLTQGILTNVLSDQSAIEYHICEKYFAMEREEKARDYDTYLDTHLQLHKAVNVKTVSLTGEVTNIRPKESICENEDTLFFHERNWEKVLGTEGPFDRIIICKDNDAENMAILNEIKTFFVTDTCHIKYTDVKILKELWDCDKEGIEAFGVNKELYDPEVILKEKLFRYAKMIHARYFAKHQCRDEQGTAICPNQLRIEEERGEGVRETRIEVKCLGDCASCPKLLADWNRQNNFIRYSNVAQADHMEVKLRLLLGENANRKEKGIGARAVAAYHALTKEEQEALWKIEHIRWNRYHFMNNYDYAPVRDKKNRKHHLLIPYEQLEYKEREKDGDAYLALEELL